MRLLSFSQVIGLGESYLVGLYYYVGGSYMVVNWCKRVGWKVVKAEVKVIRKWGQNQALNYFLCLCEALNSIGYSKDKKVVEVWFDDENYDVERLIYEVRKKYGNRFTKIFFHYHFYDFRRCGLNAFYKGFLRKVRKGFLLAFTPLMKRRIFNAFGKALNFCYNLIMPKRLINGKQVYVANRRYLSYFYDSLLKQLTGDSRVVKRKKKFLITYINTLSFRLSVFKSGVDINEFNEWLEKDEAFRKIFEEAKKNRSELIEFLLLCKGGIFGEEVKKEFQHIDEKVLSKLLTAYSIYETNLGFTGSFTGQNFSTTSLLGREIRNTSISVEEQE